MHIFVSLMMLTTISCTVLNAAADKKPAPEKQELFALYDPSCSSCCKSTIGMRGGIDEKNKQLTLTLIKDDQPISDTVELSGNELYVQRLNGARTQFKLTHFEHIKLSLAAKQQYPGKKDQIKAYRIVHDPYLFNVYICRQFLMILDDGHLSMPTVPTSYHSVASIISVLKTEHASNPDRYSHPLIIVDINQWLINCFGKDWQYTLPIYRDPVTRMTMTQTEWDAKYPKTVTAKKTSLTS